MSCADGLCGTARAVGRVTYGGTVDQPTAMNDSLKRYASLDDGVATCWLVVRRGPTTRRSAVVADFELVGHADFELVGQSESWGLALCWVEGRRNEP